MVYTKKKSNTFPPLSMTSVKLQRLVLCVNGRLIWKINPMNGVHFFSREEEIKWYQRSKAQVILEGYNNTRYFYMVSNGRQRKKSIFSPQQDERRIKVQAELKRYITAYYNPLWGPPDEGNFTLESVEWMAAHKPRQKRMISLWHLSLKRRCVLWCSKWNITNLLALMASLPSFINTSGISSRLT